VDELMQKEKDLITLFDFDKFIIKKLAGTCYFTWSNSQFHTDYKKRILQKVGDIVHQHLIYYQQPK